MAIFQKLSGGPIAVNELARMLPVSRPAVSQHLRVLKDAGLVLQPTTAKVADLRLVRIPLASADPRIALANLAEHLGIAAPKAGGESVEDGYAAEAALLAGQRVIPLFHLPAEYATSPALNDWRPAADGSWRLDEVWVEKDRP